MNKFATLNKVEAYNKVVYYTLTIENEDGVNDKSLFEMFIDKHNNEDNYEKLHHIMTWLKKIGNDIGAKEFYFRPEAETADTSALPPQGVDREPTYFEFNNETGKNENKPNNLRLYCFRASETVVFLFNGDIKTANKAQDCDNVRPHFKLANKLTKLLEEKFQEKEIVWNEDETDIEFKEDMELNW